MNKRKIYIMLLAVLLPMGVWGQTGVQYGVSLYKQFLTQINGGSPGSAYATLWQSYEALSPAAKTASAGSADYQQLLWEREISKEMANGLDYRRAVKKAGETLALPHCSEHETGLAVDLAQKGEQDVNYEFAGSRQSVWLERCAHRYGFILRYPRLKEHITGFAFEPWHYRYVGSESADIIKKSGICLEEFLNFYQDKYLFVTNRE